MDLDRFLAVNTPTWNRLAELNDRAGRRPGRLSGAELDELVLLYQRVSTHLSFARSAFGDPALTARLTRLVATAASVVYGTRPRTLRAAGRFFTRTFPAALWYIRPYLLGSLLFLLVPAFASGIYLGHDKVAMDAYQSPAEQAAYVKAQSGYYSAQPSAQFASQVFTNNVRVAVLAFALGITIAGPPFVLALNGAGIGAVVAVFHHAGRQPFLWGLLLPHGLIELTAVVVAGAAGMRVGWTLVDPGDRPRGRALTEEGRRSIAVVMGTAAMLAVAGTIEGFVTGSALPTAVRVGIGVAVEAAFLGYAVTFGRRAAREGFTGALGEA